MPLKRITSLVLAALLAAVCIGCSKKEPNTITAGGEKYTFDYVMKIDGEEISLAEYRYYFLNLKLQYDRATTLLDGRARRQTQRKPRNTAYPAAPCWNLPVRRAQLTRRLTPSTPKWTRC